MRLTKESEEQIRKANSSCCDCNVEYVCKPCKFLAYRIDDLLEEIDALREENDALRVDFETAAHKSNEWQQKYNELKAENETLKAEIDSAKHKSRMIGVTSYADLQKENEALKADVKFNHTLVKSLEESKAYMQKQDKELTELREENERLNKFLSPGGKEEFLLLHQRDNLREENAKLAKLLDVSSKRIGKLRQEMKFASRVLNSVKYELDSSVYTIEEDEFDCVFAARDALDKALEQDDHFGSHLCSSPNCCCVCNHTGQCPEDGPSLIGGILERREGNEVITEVPEKKRKECNEMKTFPEQALEIAEKATEGPWQVDTDQSRIREGGDSKLKYCRDIHLIGYRGLDDTNSIVKDQLDNLNFIVYSRTALPELARRLKMAIDVIKRMSNLEDFKTTELVETAEQLEAPLEDK